jgi:ATP-dependent Clp protease ATP-binding subunit ClpA
MFERYTEAARRAIFFARAEAIARDAAEIDTPHLFLGLVHEPWLQNETLAALPELANEFRQILEQQKNTSAETGLKNLPLSNAAKRALAHTAAEADRDANHSVDRGYLLRGLMLAGDKTSDRLTAGGLTLEGLRALPRPLPTKRPLRWRFAQLLQRPIRLTFLMLGLLAFIAAILYLHWQDVTP